MSMPLAPLDDYRFVSGIEQIDLVAVHAFLTTTYWSPGVAFEVVERAARHSLCFGIRRGEEQIGYARVVSDQATFAYLADVYVLEAHRGKGLASRMLERVFQHPGLQGLRRFMLVTRDAHDLYAHYGFTPLANPQRVMERSALPASAASAPG